MGLPHNIAKYILIIILFFYRFYGCIYIYIFQFYFIYFFKYIYIYIFQNLFFPESVLAQGSSNSGGL